MDIEIYIVKIYTTNRTFIFRVLGDKIIKDYEEQVIQMLEKGTVTLDTVTGSIVMLVPINFIAVEIYKENKK